MTEPRHESRMPITARSVSHWTVRSFAIVVCLLLLVGCVFLMSRYTANLKLMQLAKPSDSRNVDTVFGWTGPVIPIRGLDVDWLARWIGKDSAFALLYRPENLLVQGHDKSISDATIHSLLRESSGMSRVFIHNRDLPEGCLEAIATRHRVELLDVRLPIIGSQDAQWLSRMKQLKLVHISQFVREPRENDWSWLKNLLGLKSLSVTLWGASDRDVIALAECPASVILSLSGPMSDAALARLCDLPALQHLSLGDSTFQLHFPPGSKLPTSLESLELNWTAADDESLALISGLPQLKRVSILGGEVSDEGLRVLAKLPMLNQLWLEGLPNVTDVGMEALASSTSLREIHVRSLGTSARGLVHLMNIPAWTDIRFDEVEFHRPDAGTAYPRPTFENAEEYLQLARNRQLEIHQELNLQHLRQRE